jgi:hypothetical protein
MISESRPLTIPVTDAELKAIDDWCEDLQFSLAEIRVRIRALRVRLPYVDPVKP